MKSIPTISRNCNVTDKIMPENGNTRMPAAKEYDNTYAVTSTTAYLIGVEKEKFHSDYTTLQMDIYDNLKTQRNNRIVRNLCIVRTMLMESYNIMDSKAANVRKDTDILQGYIPKPILTALENDGVYIPQSNGRMVAYIIQTNELINERLGECRSLYPRNIKWEYIRRLFNMPNGNDERSVINETLFFNTNKNIMPFGCYISWRGRPNGKTRDNILYNDAKFLEQVYLANKDRFIKNSIIDDRLETDDLPDGIGEISRFLETSDNTVIIVDCENSDPYKLFAMLKIIEEKSLLHKITGIQLYADINTIPVWNQFEHYVSIPVSYIQLNRIKAHKSVTDIVITTATCQEHFEHNTSSFILASSDSDFWPLISRLSKARFFVAAEIRKCNADIHTELRKRNTPYCFLDSFIVEENILKEYAVISAAEQWSRENLESVVTSFIAHMCAAANTDMTMEEEKIFHDRYVKSIKLTETENGTINIQFEKRPPEIR